MRVHGRDRLIEFSRRHANAKKPLDVWLKEVEGETWKTPHDIKRRFRSADFLANNRVIFGIKGNHYRLVAKVIYAHAIVAVEWLGTHAEYEKQEFR